MLWSITGHAQAVAVGRRDLLRQGQQDEHPGHGSRAEREGRSPIAFPRDISQTASLTGRVPQMNERLLTPISTAELERRWAAVRSEMGARGIDALVMQNNN